MRLRIPLHPVLLTVLLAVLLAILAIPAAALALDSPVTKGPVSYFADDEFNPLGGRPELYGSRMVYGSRLYESYDIFMRDIDSGTLTRLTSSADDDWAPDISGNRVVYLNTTSSGSHVYVYDTSTAVRKRLTSSRVIHRGQPHISGAHVTWSDDRSGSQDVYFYDLTTGRERRIASGSGDQDAPAISRSRIVYQDDRAGSDDVYAYDVDSGVTTPVNTAIGDQRTPTISGARVAYSNSASGTLEAFDLSTGHRTVIGNGIDTPYAPDINGSRIAYTNRSTDPSGTLTFSTRLHDLLGGVDIEVDPGLTRYPEQEEPPFYGNVALDHDRIVWENGHILWAAGITGPHIMNASPLSAPYGTTPTLFGWLTDWDASAFEATVTLQTSSDGKRWTDRAQAPTVAGRFTFHSVRVTDPLYVRFTFAGESEHMATTSGVVLVSPRYEAMLHRSSWPQTIDYGRTATMVGRLQNRSLGKNVSGRTVYLEWRKATTKPWTRAATSKKTDSGGRVSYTAHMTSKTYFRFVYDGAPDLAPDIGSTMKITPRVYLSTPSAPASVAKGAAFTAHGYLKPYHDWSWYFRDDKELYIQAYYYQKQSNGSYRWTYKDTVTRTAWPKKHSTYSSYQAAMTLPHNGRWRLRAYHSERDGSHATTYSGWRYIAAK